MRGYRGIEADIGFKGLGSQTLALSFPKPFR